METDQWKYNRIVKTKTFIGVDFAYQAFAAGAITSVMTLPRGAGKSLVKDAIRAQTFLNAIDKTTYAPAPDVVVKIDFGKP